MRNFTAGFQHALQMAAGGVRKLEQEIPLTPRGDQARGFLLDSIWLLLGALDQWCRT